MRHHGSIVARRPAGCEAPRPRWPDARGHRPSHLVTAWPFSRSARIAPPGRTSGRFMLELSRGVCAKAAIARSRPEWWPSHRFGAHR